MAGQFLNRCRFSTHIYFFMFFIMTGCSSLHVDISPTVDWSHVRVIEFQRPLQDPWRLAQPIGSELKAMGFQIAETHAEPDLLFSYFTQSSLDLTAESEVLTRLKSLHVQFIDPATKTLVTAVDYFYPETSDQSAPVTGVKEIFSGLRQQIHTDINLPSAAPAQFQELQTEPLKPDSSPISIKIKDNTANNYQSEPDETAKTVLKKSDSKSNPQAVQQTRSPWLPKLKSWGFEKWGQDSANDY